MSSPSPSTIIRLTASLSSLVLIILSIATFYVTGHAFKTLATSFPADRYVWYGPHGILPYNRVPVYHMVYLSYDWTSENFIWVAAGSSIVAGLLGGVGAGLQAWRKRKGDGKVSKATGAMSYITALFALVAFLASFVSAIYVYVHRINVRQSTCHWYMGEQRNAVFKCTRELAACKIIQYLVRREEPARDSACRETQASRQLLIPLTVFSFLLVAAYGVQIYAARRGDGQDVSAEERVERLQREE